MADSIRNFIIRTLIDDTATPQLELIRDMAQGLASDVFNIKVDADTSAAQDQLDMLSGSSSDASDTIDGLSSAYDSMAAAMSDGQAIQMTADEVDALGFSMDSAVEETSVLSDAWNGLKDVAGGVSDSISGMIESIDATKIIGGAAVALGANQAFQTADLEEAIGQAYKGAEQVGVQAWLASAPPDVSYAERSKNLLMLSFHKGGPEIGADQTKDFIDVAEEYQDKYRALLSSVGAPSDITQTIATYAQRMGNIAPGQAKAAQGDILGGMGTGGRVLANIGLNAPTEEDQSKAQAELQGKGALNGLTEQQIRTAVILQTVQDQLAAKNLLVGDTAELTSHKVATMGAKIENLTKAVEDGALPYLISFVDGITALSSAISDVPGLPQLLGIATVLAIVVGVLPMVIGFLGPMIGLLGGAAGAFGMVAAAVGEGIPVLEAIGAVIAGVVGWPLILAAALIGVGVALMVAEEKTHMLSGALATFSKSEIGKDLIADVQALIGILSWGGTGLFENIIRAGGIVATLIGDIFGKADSLYKYLKDNGALDILLSFAMGGPVGLMYLEMENIRKILQGVWDWAAGIWDSILEGIVNLPQSIADLINKVTDEAKAAVGMGPKGTLNEQSQADQMAAWEKSATGPKSKNSTGDQLFADQGDNVYKAAYNQAQTGISQMPAGMDPSVYADLVKNAQTFLSQNPTVVQGPEGDKTPFKEGTPALGLGDKSNTTGSKTLDTILNVFHTPSYDYDFVKKQWIGPIAGEQGVDPYTGPMPESEVPPNIVAQRNSFAENAVKTAHEGAESSSRGLISVLPGEPIVPADLAQSSRLLDMLSMIATGPSAVIPQQQISNQRETQQPIPDMAIHLHTGDINISNAPESVNEDSVKRILTDWLNNFKQFELGHIIEETYSRGTRYYNG